MGAYLVLARLGLFDSAAMGGAFALALLVNRLPLPGKVMGNDDVAF